MKHTIRTILTSAITAIATFFMVVYISCTKDKCSSVVCQNGGSCSGGACNCPSGYEGTSCQTTARGKFTGNWGVTNTTASINEPANFAVSVEAGAGVAEVKIHNFHNLFTVPVTGIISRDSITIPSQQVQGKIVVGAGYIYSTSVYGINSSIAISYTVTDVTTHVSGAESEIWGG